jgi:hypothetical protein
VLTGDGIKCDNATGSTSTADTTAGDDTATVTGVKIDPSPVEITCTIEIGLKTRGSYKTNRERRPTRHLSLQHRDE